MPDDWTTLHREIRGTLYLILGVMVSVPLITILLLVLIRH